MRKSMENSNSDFITIANELEMINKYLELEKLRFPEIFTYSVEVDPIHRCGDWKRSLIC